MFLKGCFGSVVAFSPSGETCASCNLQKDCAEKVFDSEPEILSRIERNETRNVPDKPRFAIVSRFFGRRKKDYLDPPKPEAKPKPVEPGAGLKGLLEGKNPFGVLGSEHPYYMACELLIEQKAASLKDFSEHFHNRGSTLPRATLNKYVRKLLKLLIDSGIVIKEGSLFCLA